MTDEEILSRGSAPDGDPVMTERPKGYFKVPEDTVYLLLGILRLEKDGIKNPASNIDTAQKELKDCCQSRPVSTSPKKAAPEPKRLFPTPMCPKCPIYLVGCGCIHELGYEETGICNAGIDAAAQAAFNTPPERVAPEPDYSRHNPRIELRKVCEQEAHDAAIRQDEREKVLTQFADLIHNESVRLPPAMVDMVYSYRVAQIITTYRNSKQGRSP